MISCFREFGMENTPLKRRDVLKASATAVGVGSLATTAAGDDSFDEAAALASAEQLGPADLAGVQDSLDVAEPTAVPSAVNGLGPGSMLFITRAGGSGTSGCTANFVWEGADGTKYLGAAGHCFLQDANVGGTQYGGAGPDLADVTVRACVDCEFGGATALTVGLRGTVVVLGEVVYARQAADDGTAVGYDFGLVEIPADAEDLIDASMPSWGGPNDTGRIDAGDPVVQYGNGVVTGETIATKARTGVGTSNDQSAGNWFAALPAAPGDSGSAVQVAAPGGTGLQGEEAAGVLTHVTTTGVAGTNVAKSRSMATEADLDVSVVLP